MIKPEKCDDLQLFHNLAIPLTLFRMGGMGGGGDGGGKAPQPVFPL